MNFNENKAIYEQIVDYCHARVIAGDWPEGGRIPSTKDLAVRMGVNPRTVMKAYDELAARHVIYQRRGLGYFIADDARSQVVDEKRRMFRETQLPAIADTLRELGYTPADLCAMIESLSEQRNI